METITCKGCKKPHPGPHKTCQKCRDKVQAYRQMFKERGICVDCKQAPAVLGKSCCSECLRFNAHRKRIKLIDRRAKGLCGQCGRKAKASICARCLPKVRATKRREHKRRTAEEVCRYCRMEAVVPDKTGCRACLDERAAYSRKRMSSDEFRKAQREQRERRQAKRKAAGLCIFCTKPAAPFVKCEAHRGMELARYHLKQIKKKAAEAKQALLQSAARSPA